MSVRKLVWLVLGLGIVATPLLFSLVGSLALPVMAQEKPFEDVDLIVIGPAQKADEDRQEIEANPQDVYLELVRQKIQLLTPEELGRETQSLRMELLELQATRKLREAERQLQQLILEHPGSQAAARAKNMLEKGPALRPVPDEATFQQDDIPSADTFRTPQRSSPQIVKPRGSKNPGF